MLEEEGLASIVCKRLNLTCSEPDLDEWRQMVFKQKNLSKNVTVALVGKYVELSDAYLSVVEALKHGGIANDAEVNVKWVDSEQVEESNVEEFLKEADAILVPGGFGDRGIEGKYLLQNMPGKITSHF